MPASASPHALLRLRTPHVSLPEVTKTASPQEHLRGSHPPFGKPPGDLESKWVLRNWFRPAQIASPAPPPSSEIQKVSERRPSGPLQYNETKSLIRNWFRVAQNAKRHPHGPPQPHRAIPPNPKMICHNPAMRTLSICLLSAATLCAQVDFTALKELKYRNIGPFRGGRAVAVAGQREIPSGVQPIFGRSRSTANGSGFSPPLGCLHCAPIARSRESARQTRRYRADHSGLPIQIE